MKRRATTGHKAKKAQRNPATPKRRTAPVAARNCDLSNADLQQQLDRRTRELKEALEQQAATAEVLSVLSSSPAELEPIFVAILEKATRLCAAKFGNLYLREADAFRTAATHNVPLAFAETRRREPLVHPGPQTILGRLASSMTIVHVPDVTSEQGYRERDPLFVTALELGGFQAELGVPMLKDGNLVGAIIIYRQEVGAFTDKQIELIKAFAAQAVIAIENTRLLNELHQRTDDLSESLKQQTATSEVLQVISSSPGELEPVFQAMLENATRICEAKLGTMVLSEDGGFRHVAAYGLPPAYAELRRREPLIRPSPEHPLARMIESKKVFHISDISAEPEDKRGRLADLAGARTLLIVPMLKEGRMVGAIAIYRQEVRPFTEKQVELVKNFAAQAVIAIENTRLLSELRESLQQQTATADVLKVISRSAFELQTVLDTLIESAVRLCEADMGSINRQKGDAYQQVANYGHPPEFEAYMTTHPIPAGRGSVVGRTILEGKVVQVPDVLVDSEFKLTQAATISGLRTMLGVPLLREGRPIGVMVLQRKTVRPFTDKQIDLVTTFADQAVIAIENVRLFDEVQKRTDELSEALEQQTATSEVLKVISSSPGELGPVFEAMLGNAVRICGAKFGNLWLRDGDLFRVVATHGVPPAYRQMLMREAIRPGPDTGLGMLMKSKRFVQIEDITKGNAYAERDPLRVATVEIAGGRTLVEVPLLKDNKLIGSINIYRQEVRPFTDKQIELVQNFAAQAVIAIENTRLLNELRESLQQQTATAAILQAINSSPGDLAPVFDAILEKAHEVCSVAYGALVLREGEIFRAVATHSYSGFFREQLRRGYRGVDNPLARALIDGEHFIHVPDLALIDHPMVQASVKNAGVRTGLYVPLRKDDALLGMISFCRREIRPFSEKEIALFQNFAVQAVVAIENARLLNELRQRTDDLTESLEQQTATSDVLKVISSSPGDLAPVFQAMLDNATRICGAKFGVLFLADGDGFRSVAMRGLPPAHLEERQREPVIHPVPADPLSRLMRTKQIVHIADLREEEAYIQGYSPLRAVVDAGGGRTLLVAPMLKDRSLIGAFAIYSQEVGLFTDRQVELVKNFAAQAVIAIENTRLLNELRESLAQQTATADVLKVISNSPGELEPVFQAMLESAVRICDAKFGTLFRYDGKAFHPTAGIGLTSALSELQRKRGPFQALPGSVLDRVLQSRGVAHTDDDAAGPTPSAPARLGGARTTVAVPMLKDNDLVGAIVIYRQEVRPFTDKQIELVQNFAAQAVIAIENTRLLSELRESLQQQTATADVLKVISRSTFDLKTVLETLTELAARLSNSDFATLNRQFADGYRQVASYGLTAAVAQVIEAHPLSAGRGSVVGRTLLAKQPVQIVDVLADPDFKMVEASKKTGANTILGIPLMREGVPIGVMTLQRRAKESYTDKQIELLTTFADQAVIAIENVRLFESVEARTLELAKSLEDLRTAQDRLIQTEKLASLGQLTAGIAHEIKNPLNFVNNFSAVSVELIDELRQALSSAHLDNKLRTEVGEIADMLQGNLDKVVQHGRRADSIVKNMLLHSREGSGEHRPVDINALVEESLNLAYHGARAEKQGFNITLERSFDPTAGDVDVFPQEIMRVLLNLISNGFYAATKRKAVAADERYEPTLTAATKNLGDRVEIRIRDNGTGIPPEVKDKMFNPFFTTKPAGEGTGLGLSLSHDIVVKQHAGAIEVDTEPGEYTEFRIILPRIAATLAKTGDRA